jgi:hypothetical protein
LAVVDASDRYATGVTASPFTVIAGDAKRINKRLSAGASITGKVTTSAGKALSNTSVRLEGVTTSGVKLPLEYGTTNSGGEFRIRGLAAGAYTVDYQHDGYVDTSYNGSNGIPAWYGTGKTVSVGTGKKHTGTSVSLEISGKITGRVLVNGVEANEDYGQVTASVLRKADSFVLSTQEVGDFRDNSFKFPGLPPGDYVVRFAAGSGAPIVGADLPITLAAGQQRSGLLQQLATNGPTDIRISDTTSPDPLVPSPTQSFTVAVAVYGYSSAAGATITLSYDGSIKQTGTLDVHGSTSFTVPSDFWIGKPGGSAPQFTLDVTPTATTKAGTAHDAPYINY